MPSPPGTAPGWAPFVAYPVLAISALGIVTCAALHIASFFIAAATIERYFNVFVPFIGVFAVQIPAIFVGNYLSRDFKRGDYIKAVMRGCPAWMSRTLNVVFIYAAIVFVANLALKNERASLALVSIFPIMFYLNAFCTMYSLLHLTDPVRRCPNGHAVSPAAKFCEECGAPVEDRGSARFKIA